VPVYRIAAVYLALGDKEQALEWLESAYREDPGWLVWLKVDPVMDPLRSDLRFQELLRGLNFPPSPANPSVSTRGTSSPVPSP